MNDVNLAPENKEATPEHGYLMAYDKKEQKAKGVKGIAANGELETLEANEANRDQFIKVDQRGNFFTNYRTKQSEGNWLRPGCIITIASTSGK